VKALIIYESMFGNTRTVAEAIAEGLAERIEVEVVEVGEAPTEPGGDIELLVVGGPTHAHGVTNAQSRASAAKTGAKHDLPAMISTGIGIREWLDGHERLPASLAAASFDTRIKGPRWLWGSAARAAAKRLRALGARVVVPGESFLISGPTGPIVDVLLDGEVDRARAWGRALVDLAGQG